MFAVNRAYGAYAECIEESFHPRWCIRLSINQANRVLSVGDIVRRGQQFKRPSASKLNEYKLQFSAVKLIHIAVE